MIIIGDDMPTWNADQYLKFADERTRPCRDLVAAISITFVRRIIDLGCGPGNSTRVLERKWPGAEITGLDTSAPMIDVARREQPQHRWAVQEITEWAANAQARQGAASAGEAQARERAASGDDAREDFD